MIVPILGILFSVLTGVPGIILIINACRKFRKAEKLNQLVDYLIKDFGSSSYEDLAEEASKANLIGLVVGIVLGGGVSALSYELAMLIAKASTGIKISELNGVANKNATLAYFGGGSLSTGGLGMQGGRWVLAGIVLGPALLTIGYIENRTAKKALNRAEARKLKIDAMRYNKPIESTEEKKKDILGVAHVVQAKE